MFREQQGGGCVWSQGEKDEIKSVCGWVRVGMGAGAQITRDSVNHNNTCVFDAV